jgi:hypothetical protein
MVTEADQVGIRYEGGALFQQAPTWKECQGRTQQHYGDAGDGTYVYFAGQRTAKFSDNPADRPDFPALRVSAPSPGGGQPIEMIVPATVFFTPNFDDCNTLRQFHERIGRKYEAWSGGGGRADDPAAGWKAMMGVYIKDPTDLAADRSALGYDWVRLSSNEADKQAWEKAIAAAIQGTPADPAQGKPAQMGLIEQIAGAGIFKIDNVIVQRPDLPQNIKDAISNSEAERQRAVTAEQFKAAAASFPGGATAYQEFQRQAAINKAIESGQVKIIPVPQGSPIIVQPGQ